MSSIKRLAQGFLRELQQRVSDLVAQQAKNLELQTRTVVSKFLEDVVETIRPRTVIQHESHVGRANRPDWRIEDPITFGIYAYADHKGLVLKGPPILDDRERRQVQRYLDLGRPVFIFDGIDFLFYTDSVDHPEKLSLVEKPLKVSGSDWSTLPINPLVEVRLRALLEKPGFKKWTETELIHQLALRANILSEAISELLDAPIGSGQTDAEQKLIAALHELHELARENHDPTLTDKESCANFIAQVLVFGLFYAHVTAPAAAGSPEARRAHISGFWTSGAAKDLASKLRPFQTIVDVLGETLNVDNALSDWYGDVVTVLAHAEYMGTMLSPTDFHALFERFFEAFDKQQKFDRGVFFTPELLTGWMVELTDGLLRTHFGGPMAEVVDKLIDPCCGTGGFLEAAVNLVGDVTNGPHFIGFEILPAPYALAHYRLSRIGSDWSNPPMVSIMLTDTLSDRLVKPPAEREDGFTEELAEASELARPPVRVVIGNPPSTSLRLSQAPRAVIEAMVEDFRPPLEERRTRQNIQKGLNNEAFRFLRWSANEILASGTGIMTLLLPDALAIHATLSYARKWLIDSFDTIYVLKLDSDQRTGQATGQPIFDVMQGRLVLVAIRSSAKRDPAVPGEVLLMDLSDASRSEKEKFLTSDDLKMGGFKRVAVAGPRWQFGEANNDPSELWMDCWPLLTLESTAGVFRSKCSAVKLAPSSMLFHTDQLILQRRSGAVSARSGSAWTNTVDKLLDDWWRGQQKPPRQAKFTDAVRGAIGQAAKNATAVRPYTFRPFVDGFVLESDEVFRALSETPGGGTRARPEIRAAFSQGACGIAVAAAPVDIGAQLTRFASFCWDLPDNDIVARGNAFIYCDKFPDEKRGSEWDSSVKLNLSDDFLGFFQDAKAALFYVYGIMSCEAYLQMFEPHLYQPSDPNNPPRIPLVADVRARGRIAQLGRQAAECERPDFPAQPLSLTTEWPDGLEELLITRFDIDANEGLIVLHDSEDKAIRISDIPAEVLSLRVSGHNVVDKWLRERKYAYLRRAFRQSDLELLVNLLARMKHQILLLEEVSDELVGRALRTGRPDVAFIMSEEGIPKVGVGSQRHWDSLMTPPVT